MTETLRWSDAQWVTFYKQELCECNELYLSSGGKEMTAAAGAQMDKNTEV